MPHAVFKETALSDKTDLEQNNDVNNDSSIFAFVNYVVQFQLIKKVKGNAKSLRVTKALDLFIVKSCSIQKADPRNFHLRSSY